MAGRAQQSFKKRQKEQQRKEKQQFKFAKRMQRKQEQENRPPGSGPEDGEMLAFDDESLTVDESPQV